MPGGAYRSSQEVAGLLKYRLTNLTEFTSPIIELKGKGKCSWLDSDSGSTARHAKEKYVFLVRNILHRSNNHKPAGVFGCPFGFVLPTGLPSSLKDKTGKISYKVTARFSKVGFLGSEIKFEREIYVYGYVETYLPEPVTFGLT